MDGVHYQFRAMPFGITVAPRVLTKLMAAVDGHLRSQQIHIFLYLDDWLVKNQIRELLLHQLNQTMQLLVDLGLIINLDKCHLVPSEIITYLGAVLNLNKGLVLPSENRFVAIKQAIAYIIYNANVELPIFTTVGTNDVMHRYSSIWPFTYAPYPNIPSLFLAPTYRWTTVQNSSFPHTSNTLNVVATREEYFQRGTLAGISTQQSYVDRCIQVGLGCTLGH